MRLGASWGPHQNKEAYGKTVFNQRVRPTFGGSATDIQLNLTGTWLSNF